MNSNKTTLVVGSKNPIKLNAARLGFARIYRNLSLDSDDIDIICNGIDVPSNVPDQPIGDEETKKGAINRAKNVYEEFYRQNNYYPSFAVGPIFRYFISIIQSLNNIPVSIYQVWKVVYLRNQTKIWNVLHG